MFGNMKIIKAKRLFRNNPKTGLLEIVELPKKEVKVNNHTIQGEREITYKGKEPTYYNTIKALRCENGLKIPRKHIKGERGRYFYEPS